MVWLPRLLTARVDTKTLQSTTQYILLRMVALTALDMTGFLNTAAEYYSAVVSYMYQVDTCLEGLLSFWVLLRFLWLLEFNVKLVWMVVVGKVKGPEEGDENVPDLIRKCGYQVETHEVTTEDGYKLEMHRIPSRGPVVFLQHGMLCASYCWVLVGTYSLAFILAAAGYDVWMGNFRGTKYGRKHQEWHPDRDRKEFWSFTIHEHGDKDLAAMFTEVLKITNQKRLKFIGHSMGTTSFLILASTRPELVNSTVNLAILMAPVVEPHNMTNNLLWYLAPFHKCYRWILERVHCLEILPFPLLIEKFGWDTLGKWMMKKNLSCSPTRTEDSRMLTSICHHARTSKTSIYTILHYAQNISNKYFHAYDWNDASENMKRYGSTDPPTYDLSKCDVPCALFWSSKDSLSSVEDKERIERELHNNIVFCKDVQIGHLDYLWGSNVVGDLYYDLLKTLSDHTTPEEHKLLSQCKRS